MDRLQPTSPVPLDTPADVVAEALQALNIATEHSSLSLEETRHWLRHDGIDDLSLADLTHLPFVTIDNPGSRDLDQALLIERQDPGAWRVRYALADAAYYVRPGSALFAEALARGVTYYTPLLNAPMLPVELSEGLISLNPGVDRRALVFDMLVDEQAVVSRCSIVRARIHSVARLDYASVQAWLDSDPVPSRVFDESLLLLRELGSRLIDAATRRGVIGFNRTETRISVAGNPPHFEATSRIRYLTERYNEQISLICNAQGADMLLAMSGVSDALQAIYRVHEAPLKKSLRELRGTLQAFAAQQDDPSAWEWKPDQALADYVDQLPAGPGHRRRVTAVQRQIMQAQRASSFTPQAGEHHALQVASYARFSAPMREVVGIFTHKELLEALGGHDVELDRDTQLRDQVIAAANESRQRQRNLDKRIEFATLSSVFARELAQPERPLHSGTIMGLKRDRLYVRLDDMALDVKLYREDLERQFGIPYAMDDVTAQAMGENAASWSMGQGVRLRIREYESTRHRFLFDLEPLDPDSDEDFGTAMEDQM